MNTLQCDECGSKAFAVRIVYLDGGQTLVKRLNCRTCGETFDVGAMPTMDDWD